MTGVLLGRDADHAEDEEYTALLGGNGSDPGKGGPGSGGLPGEAASSSYAVKSP